MTAQSALTLPGQPLVAADFDAKFRQWRNIVDKMHATTRFTPNPRLAWTPLSKPIRECTVALVTTAGAHPRHAPAFDLLNEDGDASFRVISADIAVADLTVSHSHYDTTDALADPNVIFPIDRLRELVADGTVGALSPIHIGMMGWNPDGERVRNETAPAIARELLQAGVDAAVLTPG